jgi:phage-related protein
MFEVKFYALPHGEKPAWKFLDGLDAETRAKALAYLLILGKYGYTNWGPYLQATSDGLFELHIITPQTRDNKLGDHPPRIIFFFCTENEIVLTNGYAKRTIKTPAEEIKIAKKYRADHERRK